MQILLKLHVQYSPKIMHAQELLFASASRQLLAASCGSLALGSCETQELLCGRILEMQELLCGRILETQELLCGRILETQELLCGRILETQELLCGRILKTQELLCGRICKLPT